MCAVTTPQKGKKEMYENKLNKRYYYKNVVGMELYDDSEDRYVTICKEDRESDKYVCEVTEIVYGEETGAETTKITTSLFTWGELRHFFVR